MAERSPISIFMSELSHEGFSPGPTLKPTVNLSIIMHLRIIWT
jgi:hypothetical protein